MLYSLFLLHVQVEVYQAILVYQGTERLLLHYIKFISLPASFSTWFSKNIFQIILLIDIAWMSLFLEILANMSVAIVSFPVCDVVNFEIKAKLYIS